MTMSRQILTLLYRMAEHRQHRVVVVVDVEDDDIAAEEA